MKKLSFFLMAMLISLVSFAQDAPIYELVPATGSNNSYAGNCDITIDGIKWNLTGNSTMQPWRIGGKSITNQDRALYSKTPLAYNIDKIEVTHGTASSITVNSFKLIISDEANGAGETIDVAFKASATTTIDLPEGDYSNKYFKFLYNVTVSGTSNKYVQFTGAKFYAALAEDAVKAPIIKGAEDFISETEVTIEAEDDVTVYYTLDGTDPTTASTVYAAPFTVKETTTVKAIAYRGETASFVTSATFTQATRVTAAEAAELAMKVASNNALTSVTYVINAYVTSVIDQTLSSGQQRFWVADTKDGGQVLQSYYCNVPQVLKVGDYIQMFGKLTKYNTSPQMKNGDVTILEEPAPEPVMFTVTATAENGTVEGAGEYEEGTEATLTATANEGYEFICWTVGEDTVSTENPYTFAVTADIALVANFKEVVVEPTTETVYFINAKKWAKVNVYAWTTDPNAAWPGAAATKEAEQIAGYDVYSFTANAGQYANVIFNDGSSQTPDLVWTAGKYYVIDMGWLTKEEAETKLAAPLPETWNIVGAAGLMGTDWNLNDAKNLMTLQADGTYLLEKKGITLTAGTYEYKAAKDHGWTVAVPQDGNQKLTISTSGIYDVTFVLNVTAKKLTATATLKQAAVVIPTIVIAGDMNSWNQTKDKFTMSADSLTATFKATLAVKNYGFKMIVGGAWHSDGKTITRAANSTKFTGANSNTNSTLKADIAGEYLFTWEYATKTLTVTYPALPVKYNVTVTAENGTVTGAGEYEEGATATLTATAAEGYEFVNWTVGEEVVSTENPYSFVVTADVALVANFKEVEPEIEWLEMPLEITNLTTEVMEVEGAKYLLLQGRDDMNDADVMLFLNNYADVDDDYEVNTESSYMTFGGMELTVLEGVMTQTSETDKGTVYNGIVRTYVAEDSLYVAFSLTMYAAPATVIELTDAVVAINEDLGTLTFNVATDEGGYFVELAGYTAPGVHEGPQICLFETPEAVAFANYVETSVVDGVITLTGEFTSFMGAKFALTISGKLPVVEPEVITYELNGGEFPAVVVPTNAELWEAFKPYYNEYYGLARADQPIDKVTTFANAKMQEIMTDETSEYKWLGDYVQSVATAAGVPLSTDMASANESGWRWAVHAFFNAAAGQYGAAGIDFTEAGKQEVWGAAYEAEYGVVLPTEPVAEDYVLPTPTKEGYTFVGWYDNAEGTGEPYKVIPAGWAGTLYAIWKQDTTTALDNIAVEGKVVKAIINGQLIIIKNGVQYNAQGVILK